jgi:hypothetical protein
LCSSVLLHDAFPIMWCYFMSWFFRSTSHILLLRLFSATCYINTTIFLQVGRNDKSWRRIKWGNSTLNEYRYALCISPYYYLSFSLLCSWRGLLKYNFFLSSISPDILSTRRATNYPNNFFLVKRPSRGRDISPPTHLVSPRLPAQDVPSYIRTITPPPPPPPTCQAHRLRLI